MPFITGEQVNVFLLHKQRFYKATATSLWYELSGSMVSKEVVPSFTVVCSMKWQIVMLLLYLRI